jgi:fluoride ion exporter CrcB/FEX
LIKVGFLGALTTFSTYCLNVVDLARQNNIKEAVLVLCLNVFFGIIIGVWMFRDDIFQ